MSRWRMVDEVTAFERRARVLDRLAPPPGVALPASLLDCLPVLTPGYERPPHLDEAAAVLEAAPHGGLRCAIHAGPRWGKTELVIAAIVKHLRRNPRLSFMFAAHSAGLAMSKSARARDLAHRAGVRISQASRAKNEWLTVEGGGVRAFGFDAGGPLGHGCDVLFCDDPYAGVVDAASAATRERVWESFRGNLLSRVEPDGSVIIIAQRLHEEDLTHSAITHLGYRYICITPRDEKGESRWPTRFPNHVLAAIEKERGPFLWASQYLGAPRPRDGERLYDGVTHCTLADIPATGLDATGCDLAHTAKDRSDPHAAVTVRRHGDLYDVIDVREKLAPLTREERNGRRVDGFVSELRDVQRIHSRTRLVMYAGGNAEPLILALLAKLPPDERVSIFCMRAGADKYLRSLPTSALWRAGKIRVPKDAPWADKLVAHLNQYTGAPNGVDDIGDALAAAVDYLARGGSSMKPSGTGTGSEAARLTASGI